MYTNGPTSSREAQRDSATEMHTTKAIVDGIVVSLDLWVATQDKTIRHLLYMATEICIVTYDPTNPDTIDNISNFWVPELLEHLVLAVWLLVPVRIEDKETHVKTMELAEKIGSSKMISSGDSIESVKAVFEAGVRLGMQAGPEAEITRIEMLKARQKLLRERLKKTDDASFKSTETERLMKSLDRVDTEIQRKMAARGDTSFARRLTTIFGK
jgi:GTPase SAR1 family protein